MYFNTSLPNSIMETEISHIPTFRAMDSMQENSCQITLLILAKGYQYTLIEYVFEAAADSKVVTVFKK